MSLGDTALVNRLKTLAGERLARIRRKMEAGGYDLIVVASPENVLYATGYESMGATISRRYDYAALVTRDAVLLVAPAADFAPAIDAGFTPDDIFPFGKFFFSGSTPSAHTAVRHASFAEAFDAAVQRVRARRIVAEKAHLPSGAMDILVRQAGDIADAGSWMFGIRATKLPFEVELLRYATEITQQAIDAGINAARVGMTDKEVASVVASQMALGGGLPRNVTVVGGERSALADAMSSERPLQRGDLLRFDVGCSYYGYKSDMARTAVIGEPSRLQSERYAALLEGLLVTIDAMRPGTRACDVFAAGVATVEARGLRPFRRQHIGHAIGMAVYETPVITPESEDILVAGTTFCLETPYYEPGWGGMMVEDTGILTEEGFSLFSSTDRTLRIVAD
ncbi:MULTISPECIES: Xaa-Pro peptidase family protein [unclassified Chelatococcus]|uniref:M24 family metallopeptidase n=1 Tax=unclassified Chelatococcus TaxID=2638111 RepID=UPI001BCE76C2|nr:MULTISPECIES: Xaa-Pro peptidase family protein [unclassified Chelatococcus]MBS7700406.1 aminopeptidase P family protein [Chelatococcus sp. YT9]MBX3556202.1 aminopeptidase P family protein [Chelatococcus sp.]